MARPDAVSNVASGAPATSAWANDVADGINTIAGDIYGATQLEIPWASITGKPATFAPSAHGHDPAAIGAATTGHGHTASAVGAWAKLSAGGGAAGVTIHVGTTAPSSPAEGDIWIKG